MRGSLAPFTPAMDSTEHKYRIWAHTHNYYKLQRTINCITKYYFGWF